MVIGPDLSEENAMMIYPEGHHGQLLKRKRGKEKKTGKQTETDERRSKRRFHFGMDFNHGGDAIPFKNQRLNLRQRVKIEPYLSMK